MTVKILRDTRAWRTQVWASFGIAAGACAVGLGYLESADISRVFLVMAYLFSLSATFGLSKYVRDREQGSADTPLWGWVVWGGFAVAIGLTAWGLYRMDIQPVWKAYLGLGWLFLVSTTFTLAKMLRDRHEADKAEAAPATDRVA